MKKNPDTWIALGAAGAYLALSAVLLPFSEYARALGGGMIVFALVAGVARWMGRGPILLGRLLVVLVGSMFVFLLPTFPAEGGRYPIAIPLGFSGMQVAMVLWASLRWEHRPPGKHISLRRAWRFGLLGAAVLSIAATLPIAAGLILGGIDALPMLLVYPGYLIGLFTATTIYWGLQHFSHYATGEYLIGALGGTCVVAALLPLLVVIEGPMTPHDALAVTVGSGMLLGPLLALSLSSVNAGRRHPERGTNSRRHPRTAGAPPDRAR